MNLEQIGNTVKNNIMNKFKEVKKIKKIDPYIESNVFNITRSPAGLISIQHLHEFAIEFNCSIIDFMQGISKE